MYKARTSSQHKTALIWCAGFPLDMSDNALRVASLCAAISFAFIWKWRRRDTKRLFPPGPKGLPLLGNVFDIPKGVPVWLTFTSMSQKYGMYPFHPAFPTVPLKCPVLPEDTDVLYLRVLTTDMIILNNSEVVSDLLEKRSNIYSDRVSTRLKPERS